MEEENKVNVTESMDDYKEELEASLKKIRPGDMMTGTIVDVSDNACTVDLKYYAPGIIRREDMSSDPEFNMTEALKVGDSITAAVIRRDDGAGNILLSAKEANDTLAWEKLEAALKDQTRMEVKVGGVVKGGVIALVYGIRGFIPASRIGAGYIEDLESLLGQTLEVIVITADREANKLVLSGREAAREKEEADKRSKIDSCAVGTVLSGRVESLKPYGAFIALENGLSGLVHISQMSPKRIKTPGEVVKAGETVQVKIIGNENGRLSLSMKALAEVLPEEEEALPAGEREYKDQGEAATGLGALLAGLKL